MSAPVRKNSKISKDLSLSDPIDGIPINDENWSCIVTMLVESREDQVAYTSMLNDACKHGCGRTICAISRERVLADFRAPVTPEPRKAGRASLERIRHEAGQARLIKRMIYEARLESLELRGAAPADGEPAKSAPTTPEDSKPNSRLRKRAERWRAPLDDAPPDGPDLYIILTGFRDPGLPLELIKLGVPLNCILKLDLPENDREESTSSTDYEVQHSSDHSSFSPDSSRSVPESEGSSDFWRKLEAYQLCELIVRPYCPGRHVLTDPGALCNNLARVLQDVRDALQAHAEYLSSLRLARLDPPDLIDPLVCLGDEEHGSVDGLLEAMLRRLEDDFNRELGEQTHRENDGAAAAADEHSSTSRNKAAARLAEKLRLLNLKHGLVSRPREDVDDSSRPVELILHGDALRLNARRANDDGDGGPSFEVRLFEEPWIAGAWRPEDDEEVQNCKEHLPGILKCCVREGIDPSRAKHLLNLLGFWKLFGSFFTDSDLPGRYESPAKGQNNKPMVNSKNAQLRNESYLEKYSTERGKSKIEFEQTALDYSLIIHKNEPNFKINEVSAEQHRRRIFDELIKEAPVEDVNRNPLLNVNSKKMSVAIEVETDKIKNICEIEDSENESVENGIGPSRRSRMPNNAKPAGEWPGSWSVPSPPSQRNKSEALGLCSLSARRRDVGSVVSGLRRLGSFERCSPLFGLIDAPGRESPPPGLEDFQELESLAMPGFLQIVRDCLLRYGEERVAARHFAATDSILLLFCREARRPGEIIERRATCALRTAVCLRDFWDYVVPEEPEWLERRRAERDRVRATSDAQPNFRDEDFFLPGSLKARQLEESFERKLPVDASSSKPGSTAGGESQSDSSEDGRLEFVGYDLGEHRVQVSNLAQTYQARDGTLLRLEREQWLLGDGSRTGRTSARLSWLDELDDWSFWCQESESEPTSLFHLIMENGTIVAFSRRINVSKSVKQNELLYEFQMSLPSGLIIKSVDISDANYPYYILQYYASKMPRCDNIKDETHRKYLLNGDVVKFMKDGSVIVLRPNGTIITIPDFDKGDRMSKSDSYLLESLGHLERTSFLHNEELRYSVLQLDGRHYEVEDGRVVRELQPLRARLVEAHDARDRFARREDGTDALFNAEAELVVAFPDGTRSVFGCSVEESCAHCDWTAVELERVFGGRAPEGFVSVLADRGRVEHPRYASLGRESSLAGWLAAAGPTRLTLGPRGLSELRLDDRTRLELDEEGVRLTRRSCGGCEVLSFRATFPADSSSELLLSFQDGSGCVFARRVDGRLEKGCDCNDREPVDRRADWQRCRLFALGRDGAAHEYHHRAAWAAYEARMAEEDGASLICRSDERRPGMESRIALQPLHDTRQPIPTLQTLDVRPSWRVVAEEDDGSWDGPFLASSRATPVLNARLLESIGRPGDESLARVREALASYWREVATGARGDDDEEELEKPMMCECQGDMETRMRDIASGRARTIDREIYEAGRQHLRKMKMERDEQRTRQMIDRTYRRSRASNECFWRGDE